MPRKGSTTLLLLLLPPVALAGSAESCSTNCRAEASLVCVISTMPRLAVVDGVGEGLGVMLGVPELVTLSVVVAVEDRLCVAVGGAVAAGVEERLWEREAVPLAQLPLATGDREKEAE